MGGAAAIFKQASDPGSSAVAGDLWSDTDNEALYRRNDANDGWITLNSSEKADISPLTVTTKASSTIADYSTPSSATASSFDSDATFTWDGSATGWTTSDEGGSAAITSNQVVLTANSNGDTPYVYYDLYSAMGDSVAANTWVLRGKIILDGYNNTSSGQAAKVEFGLSSGTGGFTSERLGNDGLAGARAAHGAGGNQNWYLYNIYSSGGSDDSDGGNLTSSPVSGTFYFELVRSAVNDGQLKIYSDSTYSTLVETMDVGTFSGNPSDLRYLYCRIFYQNVSNSNTVKLDSFVFFNNTTSAVEYPASNAVDNNTSTFWKSNSESNPNIYVDVGSNKNVSQLTIFQNAATTSTEIKVQSSTNASAWTDVRKITVSNLSDGAYYYIRFNSQLARYFRIYGTDGSAKILAINEIKCEELSDGEQADLHGHLPISATSTAVALNGT